MRIRKVFVFLSIVISVLTSASITGFAKEMDASTDINSSEKNYNTNLNLILDNLSFSSVELVSNDVEIYGNTNITDREFRNKVNIGNDKIYFIYRTSRSIDLPYDALLKIKKNGKIYSYEFVEKEKSDSISIMAGILSFINQYSAVLNNNEYYSLSNNAPTTLSLEVPTTFIDCVVEKEYVMRFNDKGYIVYHIAVSRYIANSKSIIFIVTVNNSFVPGIVAKNNNESGYKNFKNQEGYVHMTVEQAYDATEEADYGRKRWGNIPYKKDYWPVNDPAVTSISSSIQLGLNLGYSFENGFSLDNISIAQNRNLGANISFGYSKSIIRREPALSVQVNSQNTNVCEWYYKYSKDASETNHLTTNYMFEISNSRNEMFIGDFRLKLDYKFVVDQGAMHAAKTLTGNSDLIVRAGEYQDIYNFNFGMI